LNPIKFNALFPQIKYTIKNLPVSIGTVNLSFVISMSADHPQIQNNKNFDDIKHTQYTLHMYSTLYNCTLYTVQCTLYRQTCSKYR